MRKSIAMQELERLDFEAKKAKYSTVPESLIPKTKFTPTNANGLATCIIRLITLHGLHAERISIISRRVGGKFIKSNMQAGSADVSSTVYGGKSLKIEVKIGKDKQSEAQKKYQQQIENSGGLYFIAKDFDSFYEYFLGLEKSFTTAKA